MLDCVNFTWIVWESWSMTWSRNFLSWEFCSSPSAVTVWLHTRTSHYFPASFSKVDCFHEKNKTKKGREKKHLWKRENLLKRKHIVSIQSIRICETSLSVVIISQQILINGLRQNGINLLNNFGSCAALWQAATHGLLEAEQGFTVSQSPTYLFPKYRIWAHFVIPWALSSEE